MITCYNVEERNDGDYVKFELLSNLTIENLLIAIIPSILILLYVYKMDIIEKEPIPMLFTLLFLGAVITIPAQFVEQLLISLPFINYGGYLNSFIMSFLVIALVEEGYKFLMVFLGTWKNKNFNHKYDGIVYAVFVSIGFATVENILYILENNDFELGLKRAVTAVPAHAFYAVACGYFLGKAKLSQKFESKKKMWLYILLSFLIPFVLHGLYDFILLTENDILLIPFLTFLAILYVVSYYHIDKVSKTKMISDIKEEGDN